MISTYLQKAAKFSKLLSISTILCLSLTHCGGGGGGGSKQAQDKSVAPESLDDVTLDLLGSIRFRFSRFAGVRGNETGSAAYTPIQKQFSLGIPGAAGGTGGVSRLITNPNVMTDVRYTYLKTGADTGKITITYRNREDFPFRSAFFSFFDDGDGKQGEIFWGGSGRTASLSSVTNPPFPPLVLDILFAGNGTIQTTTVRVRSVYLFVSELVQTPTSTGSTIFTVNETVRPVTFDSSTSRFLLAGASLPTGYDPYSTFSSTTPSRAVWPTIQGRTIQLFSGSPLVSVGRIAYQSTDSSGPPIPGTTPEESGSALIDSTADGVLGGAGKYSYKRTGGPIAKLAVNYQKTVTGTSVNVDLVYTLSFDSQDGGTYSDGRGGTGRFTQDRVTNL